nr:MAG TPA: hypothetical protein [Caudoviricetes sp.]
MVSYIFLSKAILLSSEHLNLRKYPTGPFPVGYLLLYVKFVN